MISACYVHVKNRTAVVFITRLEGDKTINDGLCLVCAKELGIKPVGELLDKFGISDEEMEQMDQQLGELMETEDGDGFTPGGAATFPFLQICLMCRLTRFAAG